MNKFIYNHNAIRILKYSNSIGSLKDIKDRHIRQLLGCGICFDETGIFLKIVKLACSYELKNGVVFNGLGDSLYALNWGNLNEIREFTSKFKNNRIRTASCSEADYMESERDINDIGGIFEEDYTNEETFVKECFLIFNILERKIVYSGYEKPVLLSLSISDKLHPVIFSDGSTDDDLSISATLRFATIRNGEVFLDYKNLDDYKSEMIVCKIIEHI